ncbi:hypothetical protein KSP39_PZI007081 [Platanthera zijinensis]|uniref:Uncharacterized protein n=1 Tax=Platanthera zijinensis TaxID=2320716 RepID=A0AAP0BQ76_9ASPA
MRLRRYLRANALKMQTPTVAGGAGPPDYRRRNHQPQRVDRGWRRGRPTARQRQECTSAVRSLDSFSTTDPHLIPCGDRALALSSSISARQIDLKSVLFNKQKGFIFLKLIYGSNKKTMNIKAEHINKGHLQKIIQIFLKLFNIFNN